MLAVAAGLALSTLSPGVAYTAESAATVEPIKAGTPLKLYETPELKDGAVSAPPDSMPLQVEGAAKNGFYPVNVRGKQYWVDGMDVKMQRANRATCTAGASVHAAGQLGAATNRCK
ncbi:hypothetical protein [Caballeronia sp. INDeC2]|uniref:hypothetical protein n=1 Tax=Caballeronia sp. INDeC2 TaxID=2921747 RepID=UPI002028F868|nr:hypothetical protein [Caballeronia sp. INDeC2]